MVFGRGIHSPFREIQSHRPLVLSLSPLTLSGGKFSRLLGMLSKKTSSVRCSTKQTPPRFSMRSPSPTEFLREEGGVPGSLGVLRAFVWEPLSQSDFPEGRTVLFRFALSTAAQHLCGAGAKFKSGAGTIKFIRVSASEALGLRPAALGPRPSRLNARCQWVPHAPALRVASGSHFSSSTLRGPGKPRFRPQVKLELQDERFRGRSVHLISLCKVGARSSSNT